MSLEEIVDNSIEANIKRDSLEKRITNLRVLVQNEKMRSDANEDVLDDYRKNIRQTLCNYEIAKREASEEKRKFENILSQSSVEDAKELLAKIEKLIDNLISLVEEQTASKLKAQKGFEEAFKAKDYGLYSEWYKILMEREKTLWETESKLSYYKTYHYNITTYFGLPMLSIFEKKLKN